MRLCPPASAAMVPVARLPRWAAVSMPRASPDTTARPASPSSRARRPASLMPAAEALRAPTTAIIGRSRTARWPRSERGHRAAELAQQGLESPWPDILAADEPQPVEPFFVGQPDAVFACAH